jgi:hypothetical protein
MNMDVGRTITCPLSGMCEVTRAMMEEYPVEDGPLRMWGTIDSRHSGRMASRNGPKSRIPPHLPWKDVMKPGSNDKIKWENVNRC